MTGHRSRPRTPLLLKTVSAAVLEVGALLRGWRLDPRAVRGEWEEGQFKAHADTMAHEALSSRLAEVGGGLAVLSEEDPASFVPGAGRPDRYWLIDPIDGTASYTGGFGGYVTQAALVVGSRPVMAAIYAPEPDVLYTAVRGVGATANGEPLPVRGPAPPGMGVLTDNTPFPRGVARAVYERFGYTAYLECGSISLKLCRIAEGAAHLFVKDVPVRDWDVAAPGLLLSETGCHLSRLDGTAFPYSGGFEHTGLIAAADPGTVAAVARWYRDSGPQSRPCRPDGGPHSRDTPDNSV